MWKYLPEVPDNNRDVLVAYKQDKIPVQAYWDGDMWVASSQVGDYINNRIDYPKLILQSHIYAWCELPKVPEKLTK